MSSTALEDAALIDAIQNDRLAELDDPRTTEVCQAIGRRVASEVDAVIDRLVGVGIEATPTGDPSAPAQRHAASVSVPDGATARRAADILAADGYRPWQPLEGAAGHIQQRFRRHVTLARTTDVTMVLTVEWPWPDGPLTGGRLAGVASRFPESLIPNENDFDAVSLPSWLWPLYFVVRPVRLAGQRLRGRSVGRYSLGPFLSTPTDLIDPLLDLVGVGSDDLLVDLGCGDGRILREAVIRRGCRAVGVESDAVLVAEAERTVVEAELGDRIEIIHGDGAAPTLPTAAAKGTVYFVFVPAEAASQLVARLAARVETGTRILAHEQHPMPSPSPGAISVPLLVGQGVTVAHHWLVA